MNIRKIDSNEAKKVYDCLAALSEHHNMVSENFKGDYPSRPFEKTIEIFENAVRGGLSEIFFAEDCGKVVGFCKIDFAEGSGKLDYLAVLPSYRGKGIGDMLMQKALSRFDEMKIKSIEIKVVAGNSAVKFYEKYGFKINAYIMKSKTE